MSSMKKKCDFKTKMKKQIFIIKNLIIINSYFN